MLSTILPRNQRGLSSEGLYRERQPTIRVLLASRDPVKRSSIVKWLRDIPLDVTITTSSRQTVARASVACSEQAWRDHSGTDFDLILVDANLIDDASELAQCLRHVNYTRPLIALAEDVSKKAAFLRAGFDDLLPLPTEDSKGFLQGIRKYCEHLVVIAST